MSRSVLGRAAVIAALVLSLAVSGGAAQDATPAPAATPALPDNCTVVMSGLLNPRRVVVGDDGTIYVTEAGIGGPSEIGSSEATPAESTAAEATPAESNEFAGATRGYTGRVSMLSPDGTQSVLSDGFASYSAGVGPSGITMVDGQLYVAVGGSGAISGNGEIGGEDDVFRVDPATGAATVISDIGQYEIANNPDGTDVNPNLFDLRTGPDGMLYLVDAGGNTIYTIDPATGNFSLFYVFPLLGELEGASTPEAGATPDPTASRQVVPTSLTFGSDGLPVVSFLGEGWPPDAPSIVTINADGSLDTIASGLQMTVSLATGPDGTLYASQLTSDLSTFAPGTILRVNDDGTTDVVLGGIAAPQGMAFDADGSAYIVTDSVAMGPTPDGKVIKCTDFGGMSGSGTGNHLTAGGPAAIRP